MAVLSTSTATLDETSHSSTESASSSGTKEIDKSSKVCQEENNSSVLSPSAVSQSLQQENIAERDDDSENENTWKGDSWSQDDVRNF